MRPNNSAGFAVKRVTLTEKGFSYDTFRLTGWLNGQRVRKQFKSREEAAGEQQRLEIEAINLDGSIQAVHTRLNGDQLADAESAIRRLGSRPISFAVDWFLANYREPVAEIALEAAKDAFLTDRTRHVRALALRDYRRTLTRFCAAFPNRSTHSITTGEIEKFLTSLRVGNKRWNNLRGDLHAFFNFCGKLPREWVQKNPVAPIAVFKISRGVPEILSLKTAAELMTYVETYAGGAKSGLPAGCLVPYFALTLFAGVRPSVPDGEVCKLGRHPNVGKLVDTAMNVIRITPEIAKTNDVRQIVIQPNLAAWITRFPLKDFPVVPKNARRMIQHVREKFALTDDVLRHTFISMHVGKFKSLGQAALEAGNSEAMIRKHYLNLVSEPDAVAFWQIVPTS